MGHNPPQEDPTAFVRGGGGRRSFVTRALPAARRCASGNTAYACEEFILPQEQPLERIDHILVVDDDRDIRELIVDYLEKSGISRQRGASERQSHVVGTQKPSN